MDIHKRINPYAHLQLRRQLYLECRAMAEYALAKGHTVPAMMIHTIEAFEDEFSQADAAPQDTSVVPDKSAPKQDIEALVYAHQVLVKIVEPATPKTILLLDMEEETPGFWKFFGPVPLVRHMMIVALLSLIFFIYFVSSQGASVNNEMFFSMGGLFFLVAAAAMGASFASLYSANSYITKGTFDPAHYASYWIRFLLGIMSGLVLALVVSDKTMGDNMENIINDNIFRPLLAILGGFSADLVYTFLNRLVETFKSLFEGSAKDIIAARSEEARARQETRISQNRMKLATDILRIQQEMGADTQSHEIQAKLNRLLQGLMPETDNTPPPSERHHT
jgi:hypothetical protein